MNGKYRQELERKKGRREQIEFLLSNKKTEFRSLRLNKRYLERSQAIIQEVSQQTQSELEYRISDLVSLALSSVSPKPYELKINFVQRRGKTEADIIFERDGIEMSDPLADTGHGACDVASFALRISLWNLPQQRTRPILILDEPFKNINDKTRQLHKKTAEMIKQLSQKLNIQFIMISFLPEIMEMADQVIEIE